MNTSNNPKLELESIASSLTESRNNLAKLIPTLIDNEVDEYIVSDITTAVTGLARYARYIQKATKVLATAQQTNDEPAQKT